MSSLGSNGRNNKAGTDKAARAMSSLISSGRLSKGIARELQNPLDIIIDSTNSTNSLLLKLTRDLSTDHEGILDTVGSIEDNLARIDENACRAYKMIIRMQQAALGEKSTQETTDIHELLIENARSSCK